MRCVPSNLKEAFIVCAGTCCLQFMCVGLKLTINNKTLYIANRLKETMNYEFQSNTHAKRYIQTAFALWA